MAVFKHASVLVILVLTAVFTVEGKILLFCMKFLSVIKNYQKNLMNLKF